MLGVFREGERHGEPGRAPRDDVSLYQKWSFSANSMMRGGLIVLLICPKVFEATVYVRSGGLKLGLLVKLKNSARRSMYRASVT